MAPNIASVDAVEEISDMISVARLKSDANEKIGAPTRTDLSDNTDESESGDRKRNGLVQWLGVLVWPAMLTLPLMLSSRYSLTSYKRIFPASWYEYEFSSEEWPCPLGLVLGIVAVAIGQVLTILYFYLHRHGHMLYKYITFQSIPKSPPPIQVKGAPKYEFFEGLLTHLSQPEGFILLTTYLSSTWMFRLMPPPYYSFEGSIQYKNLALCLILQDGIQYTMHRLEHSVSAEFYKRSHKPHHKFTNPRFFDAFNGSATDTICMILIPLYLTSLLLPNCNVWTYMAFGSVYANWLTLIHCEFPLPWDKTFRKLGLGTPGDHHVHHKFFKYNYGHTFMWFDRVCGSYKNPEQFAPKVFNLTV